MLLETVKITESIMMRFSMFNIYIYIYTVQCRYNAVNFITNIKKHPIARPFGRGIRCILWIQHLIDILPQFLQLFMQYLTILDRVITALDCIYIYIYIYIHVIYTLLDISIYNVTFDAPVRREY